MSPTSSSSDDDKESDEDEEEESEEEESDEDEEEESDEDEEEESDEDEEEESDEDEEEGLEGVAAGSSSLWARPLPLPSVFSEPVHKHPIRLCPYAVNVICKTGKESIDCPQQRSSGQQVAMTCRD